MASSLSNAKLLSAFVGKAMSRRGYAAATAASEGVGGGAKVGAMLNKKAAEVTTEKVSWVPDPKTGFYRPENHAAEIDAAELRAMLLNKNNTRAR